MIMRNKIVGIVASVAMAAVGTALLVLYVRGADDRVASAEGSVRVLVVSEAVPKGTKAEDLGAKVRLQDVPGAAAAAGALSSASSLGGQVTLVDMGPGDQVVATRFGPPALAESPGAPPGMLQVTVPIDVVRALGGRLRAGDMVGVVASFDDLGTSRMIVQKVKVTDVRTQAGVAAEPGSTAVAPAGTILHVTLALDAPSVEKVVFAAEYGKLWLSAEPENAPPTPTKTQSKATVNA